MITISLDEIESLLRLHTTAKELFAAVPYVVLARSTHPDHHIGDDKALSLFKRIQSLKDSDDNPAPAIVIKSPTKHSYKLGTLIASGDVADVYYAQDSVVPYILKISRIPEGAAMLETEQKHLAKLLTAARDSTYGKYLPLFVESFPMKTGKMQRRVNAFVKPVDFHHYYTMNEVHAKHESLDGRHLAWIFKRMLTVIGFAHIHGIIHGAILPEHCLLDTVGHGIQLVGWGQSIEKGKTISMISSKHKGMYPKEVLEKKPAGFETDIFMAANCIEYLAGDCLTVPLEIQRFINSCLLPGMSMRPKNAWELQDEFEKLLGTVYGKPRYVKLAM